MSDARNVLGSLLQVCSLLPLTGFVRDGACHPGPEDLGSHIGRALQKITQADLEYHALRAQGKPCA